MKIIFLDIDGVLATNEAYEEDHTHPLLTPAAKEKIQILEELCTSTGAKIVLSSSWRLDPGKQEEIDIALRGVTVIGKTPENIYGSRTAEIVEWLATNQYVNFVVIDDEKIDHPKLNVVRTTFRDGLTAQKAAEAINILGT